MSYQLLKCIVCGSPEVEEYLYLGEQPHANSYRKSTDISLPTIPLHVGVCTDCWHSQLLSTMSPSTMFEDYIYVSGTSNTLVEYFHWYAKKTREIYLANAKEYPGKIRVLEIACNDGTLLENYKKLGCETLGVDPAKNLVKLCEDKGLTVIPDYWNTDLSKRVTEKFDMVVAVNVLPHVPDPYDFLLACKSVLATGGKIFIQSSQCDMFSNNEFDAIYSEHFSYFTANSFRTLVDRVGLTITEATKIPVHSMSYFWVLSADSRPTVNSVGKIVKKDHCEGYYMIRKDEELKGLYGRTCYKEFKSTALNTIQKLRKIVEGETNVIGYGSSAKWNTIANAGRIELPVIIDDNPMKVGLYTPGVNSKVVSIDYLNNYKDKPVTIICTAWNFYDEIKSKIQAYNLFNVKLVKYFPEVSIEQL